MFLGVSQPSNGASCQSAVETGVTMVTVVKSVATCGIAGAQWEISFSQLSAGDTFWCFCWIIMWSFVVVNDSVAHLSIISRSDCKPLRNQTLQDGCENEQFQPPPGINPCQLKLLGSTCYLSSPSDSNFRCLSCSINDLERPHSLVLLLYLGWATEHKEEWHRLWGSELCTISEVEWTTEGGSL